MMMEELKISIVTNIYSPYRYSQFKLFKNSFPKLKVYFTNNDIQDREWQVKKLDYYHTLNSLLSFGKFGKLNSGLFNIVQNSQLVILGGYEQPTYILLSLICRAFKKPYVILFDGIAPFRIKQYSSVGFKHLLKKMVISSASAYFLNGSISKEYFTKCFGVNENKVFNQFLSVDQSLFLSHLPNREQINNEIRQKLSIPDRNKVIIYSGRLIHRKNLELLISAISIIDLDITLLVLGGGYLEKDLKDLSVQKRIDHRFVGFINENELYKYYLTSNLMVLPSSDEPWGLVVNEAVYSNLPVVVSNDVGAGLDLVVSGKNGFVFEDSSLSDLVEKIKLSLELNPSSVAKLTTELSNKWSLGSSQRSLVELVEFLKNKIGGGYDAE